MNIEMTLVILIIKMLLMMLIGGLAYKFKLVGDNFTKDASNLLLKVVVPIIILNTFLVEWTFELAKNCLIIFFAYLAFYSLINIILKVFYKKDLVVDKFCVLFGNLSFMGIPLISGLLGEEELIYLSAMIVAFNIMTWTHGLFILTKDKSVISIKQIIKNPNIIAVILGILIAFTGYIPSNNVETFVDSLTAINTPVAMFVLGIFIVKQNFKTNFFSLNFLKTIFFRLIFFPVLVALVVSFLPIDYGLKLVLVIGFASPTATGAVMFSELYTSEEDSIYSSKIVSCATLLCVVTIPLVVKLFLLINI